MEKGKILYRSVNNRIIAGVCAGIAKYLDVDVMAVRLIWAAVSWMYGIGIALYVACMFLLEDDPDELNDPDVDIETRTDDAAEEKEELE